MNLLNHLRMEYSMLGYMASVKKVGAEVHRVALTYGSGSVPCGFFRDISSDLAGNEDVVSSFWMLMHHRIVRDRLNDRLEIGVAPLFTKGDVRGNTEVKRDER